MTDPVISPDGKWMWTGSEWIPAPPAAEPVSVSMQDSVIAGDVNITQNNAEDIAAAMVTALERIGFSGQSSPAGLTTPQEKEVEQLLDMSEQLASSGIEIDPWTEITLGNAAKLAGRAHSANQHYLQALETFRKKNNREGEANSLFELGKLAIRHNTQTLAEAERILLESLAINREISNRQGEAASMIWIGIIAGIRGDRAEEERLVRESLAINREIGDREGEALSLDRLAGLLLDVNEAERLVRESLAINREIGKRDGEAAALDHLAAIASRQGDFVGAKRYGRESLAINREIGNQPSVSVALHNLATMAWNQGDLAEAERVYRECLPVLREIGDQKLEAKTLINLGNTLLNRNMDERHKCYTEAVRINREIGIPIEQWFIDNGY